MWLVRRRQQPTNAQRCKSGQSFARTCERAQRLLRGNAGQPLCRSVGTPSTCCVVRLPFCSAGAAPLRNAGTRSTILCSAATAVVLAAAVASDSSTGGCSSSSSSACSNLHSKALTDPASTHTIPGPSASEVLSVGAATTTRLVPAFVAGLGATSPNARLSFTLAYGASSCFFCDCTDLTPLHTSVTVALADPSVGSVVAKSTTTLPYPAAPSGFLTGYYTPSFSRNLVGVRHLHDLGVVTTFPLHELFASCTVGATAAPLATFHREPGSGLYSLHTGSHHTGSGLPESLAPLPCSPAPLCTPCVEGQQRAAPHSSSFPPTTAPLQTLHLDVWGPSPVPGPHQKHYFLIVVDDYSRCTTVFPLRRKADVPTVLKPWLLVRGGI
ncbi:unnamed protein product [Closterium sp. NIES-54]